MNDKFANDKRVHEIDAVICSSHNCYDCPIRHLCDIYGDNIPSWDKDEETLETAYQYLIDRGELVRDKTVDNTEEDVVNHPNHYKANAMECIDEMVLVFGKEAVISFCKCNAWKYRYRSEHKNGDEDLKKADWYIAKIKELEGVE
jgi:hypothetical protein